jgi:glycerol-3-phosphate dehydrogenase
MDAMKESGGAPTPRSALFERLANQSQWDLAVVGGGATGLGVAVDAASRGLSVVLIEAEDFAKGTSSRATKLLHGGVRYLAQGNPRLVREALHERATVLRNAPHLAQPLAFVIPVYNAWDRLVYGIGLTAYALLAGRRSLGETRWLNRTETLEALPSIRREGLAGGVRYWDAQFDDARLAIALARTAAQQGALVINHCSASRLHHTAGRVSGMEWVDRETGKQCEIRARCVVNVPGVWADEIRQTDLPSASRAFVPRVAPSRGAHLVVDATVLRSDQALMVPKTSDGRVLFASSGTNWASIQKRTNFAASRCSTHAWPRTPRFNPASRIAHRQKEL